MRFLFPFSSVRRDSRIILYGAGEVGYDFYRQIVTSRYAELALWVDRQYEWFNSLNLPVVSPERIIGMEYDYVIITAENKSVYESITKDLSRFGVVDSEIIWNEDYRIQGNIVCGYEDRDIEKEMIDAVQTEPTVFINEYRLDIIIRYLYAVECMGNSGDGFGENLYRKFIINGCNAKEPTENYISAYFSEYSLKRGVKAFQNGFKDLICSMKKNGYLKEQFLPVDSRGNLINGAHRVAAALALGEKVWYVSYPFYGLRYKCDEEELERMGFTVREIDLIRNKYEQIVSG